PMPLIIIPVVMKHVQAMSSSVTPVRRYGNPASGYESYILAVGGDGSAGAAAYSAIRASMDGDIGGSSLTVFRALRRRV
ncbi:hypothetical protein Tco_0229529, partial [Tanacetum coccineum]